MECWNGMVEGIVISKLNIAKLQYMISTRISWLTRLITQLYMTSTVTSYQVYVAKYQNLVIIRIFQAYVYVHVPSGLQKECHFWVKLQIFRKNVGQACKLYRSLLVLHCQTICLIARPLLLQPDELMHLVMHLLLNDYYNIKVWCIIQVVTL